jgi:hypothetical protein
MMVVFTNRSTGEMVGTIPAPVIIYLSYTLLPTDRFGDRAYTDCRQRGRRKMA